MGSVGNTNPWAPYDNYKDCSLGVCSIYCPQFCYLIFPPPPPSDDDSTTPFSPLIIAIIGVLASAFLLVSYYTIVTRYCKRTNVQTNAETEDIAHDDHQWAQIASSGLDEATIKTITVCKYKKGDGLIEGTDCSVCLSEFEENESLRLLPKCSHAFHLPCIDTWLKSHSNCPLCRASVVSLAVAHPVVPSARNSADFHLNSYEIQRPDDLVLVVDSTPNSFIQEFDHNGNAGPQTQPLTQEFDHNGNVGPQMQPVTPKSIGVRKVAEEPTVLDFNLTNRQLLPGFWPRENVGNDEEGVEKFRRSVSLGAFSGQREILISDIMKIEEIEEDVEVGIDQSLNGIGSSMGLLRSPVAMRRTVSTGRFMFTVQDKGKISVFPT